MHPEPSPAALNLENGRLTARPGPDTYLYAFRSEGAALITGEDVNVCAGSVMF